MKERELCKAHECIHCGSAWWPATPMPGAALEPYDGGYEPAAEAWRERIARVWPDRDARDKTITEDAFHAGWMAHRRADNLRRASGLSSGVTRAKARAFIEAEAITSEVYGADIIVVGRTFEDALVALLEEA